MNILKNLKNKMVEVLNNNKGDLVQFIGILIVIIAIMLPVMTSVGGGISGLGTKAIEKLNGFTFTLP